MSGQVWEPQTKGNRDGKPHLGPRAHAPRLHAVERRFCRALSLPAGLLAVAQAIAAGEIKDVPRNRTLVTVRGGTDGKHTEHELWSPYVIGSNPQLGGNIIYEPLAFYSAFADKTIMWLAESYKYSPDYKELTVKTRSGITWSDGKPFSAEDVAYSLNTLNELGGKVKWGKDVQEVLDRPPRSTPTRRCSSSRCRRRVSSTTCSPTNTISACTSFRSISSRARTGTKFTAFDLEKGWPVTTGPWKVVNVSPTQKVLDRARFAGGAWRRASASCRRSSASCFCPDTGRAAARPGPHLERRRLLDRIAGRDLPDRLQGQSRTSSTFTGRELPFGNVDWWPTSLYLNCERPPLRQSEIPLGDQLSDRSADADRRRLGRIVEPVAAADAGRRRLQGSAALFRRRQAAAREISDQRIQPGEGRRTLAELGWKKDGSGMYVDRGWQAVHARNHQLLRFPVGRPGAGRVAEAAGDRTRPTVSRRTCSTAFSPATTMRRSSATAAASATPTRRCGSTNRRPRRSRAGISSTSRAGRTPTTTRSSTRST